MIDMIIALLASQNLPRHEIVAGIAKANFCRTYEGAATTVLGGTRLLGALGETGLPTPIVVATDLDQRAIAYDASSSRLTVRAAAFGGRLSSGHLTVVVKGSPSVIVVDGTTKEIDPIDPLFGTGQSELMTMVMDGQRAGIFRRVVSAAFVITPLRRIPTSSSRTVAVDGDVQCALLLGPDQRVVGSFPTN